MAEVMEGVRKGLTLAPEPDTPVGQRGLGHGFLSCVVSKEMKGTFTQGSGGCGEPRSGMPEQLGGSHGLEVPVHPWILVEGSGAYSRCVSLFLCR